MLYNIIIPLAFVFLWSTGFIGAKYGLPYAEPLTFLFVRMVIACALLFMFSVVIKSEWPNTVQDILHASVVGILVHGCYLGGVFVAISRGVDAGLSALVVSLQPVATVLLAFIWLREVPGSKKTVGIIIGLIGVSIVIFARKVNLALPEVISGQGWYAGILFCVLALLGISIGTLYQKRFCSHIQLLPSICIQYLAAAAVFLFFAMRTESMMINWTGEFIFAMSWLVLVLSLGAVLLLMWLIRNGNASNVASLFYLVPPFTAVEAWLLFGESLSVMSVIGIIISVTGVALVLRNA